MSAIDLCFLPLLHPLVDPTTGISVRFVMADEGKIRVERFNGVNFEFWKMWIQDYLYRNDLYLPLGGKVQKPKEMSDG